MNINYIYLDITSKCNMDCLYCCKKNDESAVHDMEMEMLYNVLDWGKKNNANAITLSGGEPGLHNNFNLILQETKKMSFDSLRVMTNGFLFGLDLEAPNIKLVDEVCFSIDTNIEENNVFTRIGFDNSIINNIDAFHRNYPEVNLTIKSTITIYNMNDTENLIHFAIRHNFRKVTFGFCLPVGKGSNIDTYNHIRGSSVELFKIQRLIIEMKQKYGSLIEIVEPCVVFGCKLINDSESFDLHIDENGFIYPCDGMNNSEDIIANIRDDNLEEKIIRNLECIKKRIWIKNKKCKMCSILKECEGCCLLYGNALSDHDADLFCEFRRLKIMQNKLMRYISNV